MTGKRHARATFKGRRMEPVYVKRRQRFIAVVISAVILLIGATIYIGVATSNHSSVVADYEGSGNGTMQLVEIPEGSSMSEIGPELVERGIIASNASFQSAAAANPGAASIQPGFFRLQEQMSAASAVSALLDPANQVDLLDIHGGATLMDVTVVGGATRLGIFSQIAQVTCTAGSTNCITAQSLQQIASTVAPAELGVPQWAIAAVESRGNDPKRLEGLIMPGRYVVNPEDDARGILRDLITRSATQFADTDIEGRARVIGLTPYELLTAASLIEREAPAGDFDKVARVILNRLALPMPLQFDSTVNYGLSEQEVATTDEDRATETPWNTYARDGLPATPIAAASLEALHAMENPAEGSWLYFVTIDSSGTTVFNDTFEQHQEDTRRALESGVLDSNR
ncbi:endolytic transglycosylase MltG [Corynebacterium pacaense]|uniref:endolytic transglycosylase MltG n=1 Tax=Corynebacterium pacaense TaxID=1816684 RepID=UPI001FE5C955|nr:endolytic transglycosylase MltG [Corynebacterium pacaense]